MNLDIFNDPKDEIFDDKIFSPVHNYIPPEFYFQANGELDGRCGLQYGTNETNIADILNFVNWDGLPLEDPYSQMQNTLFNVKQSVSGGDSVVDLTNMTVSNRSNAIYLLVILCRFCHQSNEW